MLDEERKDWKRDTIIMLDNAPYHKSAATLKVFKEHNVSVLFSGPYSYDASPCELWFAAFKRADINPRHLKTSKW